ncbi:MAG: rod-binding protein [Sphingomonadaceae bacterium]|nr:rod-binding protein [Sphingomonadaceae bacterium]
MQTKLALPGAYPQSPGAAPAPGGERARLAEVAKQFEAIFLRQLLASARATDFGGDELFGGQGMETFTEMRDARFAEIAAGTGALGLASMIEMQLARHMEKGA